MEQLGTISCIIPYDKDHVEIHFCKTFTNLEINYQKDLTKIARIDWEKLFDWFKCIIDSAKTVYINNYSVVEEQIKIAVVLERPMINADRFKQSINAARAFEATIVVLEMLNLKDNYIIIDSKKWQHYFFGKNTVLIDLKEESKKLGISYLSEFGDKYKKECDIIESHGDADSLLISKFALEKLR